MMIILNATIIISHDCSAVINMSLLKALHCTNISNNKAKIHCESVIHYTDVYRLQRKIITEMISPDRRCTTESTSSESMIDQ